MSQASVAFRYAKPLLDLAIEKKLEDRVQEDLTLFKETCDINRELQVVLKNPVIRGYKKYGIFKSLFSKRFHELTLSLFEIMTRKNRENLLYEVGEEYQNLYNLHKGIQHITVTSAAPLDSKLKKELSEKLANDLGKTIVLNEQVEPELIGGFIVKVGNSQIDNSIKSNLQKLKRDFIKNIYN